MTAALRLERRRFDRRRQRPMAEMIADREPSEWMDVWVRADLPGMITRQHAAQKAALTVALREAA